MHDVKRKRAEAMYPNKLVAVMLMTLREIRSERLKI